VQNAAQRKMRKRRYSPDICEMIYAAAEEEKSAQKFFFFFCAMRICVRYAMLLLPVAEYY